jgi:hypothetical protein
LLVTIGHGRRRIGQTRDQARGVDTVVALDGTPSGAVLRTNPPSSIACACSAVHVVEGSETLDRNGGDGFIGGHGLRRGDRVLENYWRGDIDACRARAEPSTDSSEALASRRGTASHGGYQSRLKRS